MPGIWDITWEAQSQTPIQAILTASWIAQLQLTCIPITHRSSLMASQEQGQVKLSYHRALTQARPQGQEPSLAGSSVESPLPTLSTHYILPGSPTILSAFADQAIVAVRNCVLENLCFT